MCPAMVMGEADVQHSRGMAVSHRTRKKKLVTLGGGVALDSIKLVVSLCFKVRSKLFKKYRTSFMVLCPLAFSLVHSLSQMGLPSV